MRRYHPSVVGLLSCAGPAFGRLYEHERWQAEHAQLLQRLTDSEATDAGAYRAALSALAGAIAHEINSPLFAARAGLALLAEDDPGEPLVAGARADLARIAAVLETLQTFAQEAPFGQRLGPILTPPTA